MYKQCCNFSEKTEYFISYDIKMIYYMWCFLSTVDEATKIHVFVTTVETD